MCDPCPQLVKFDGDRAPSHLKIVDIKGLPMRAQTADDAGMVPWVAFECRGMEPIKWHPSGTYCAESNGGTVYEDVSFRDGEDWCEYDEKSEESMTIGQDIAHAFETHKGK